VSLKIDVAAAVVLEINAVAALALVTDAVAFCMEDYSYGCVESIPKKGEIAYLFNKISYC
jgi:hypothetical protein